jgi:GNAT superfamily N-acetyltransferase
VHADLDVVEVGPADWQTWRDLRLEGLADTPIGFGQSHVDALGLRDEDWQQALRLPGIHLIAYSRDGRPVGLAVGGRDQEGTALVTGTFVRPAMRGQGVLAALVDAMAKWAAPDPLALDVHEDNVRAQKAYLKLGFEPTDLRTRGGGIDGRDLIRMCRS